MAKINYSILSDPTLDAMNQQILEKKKKEKPRNYLGASEIGNPCHRKLFYSFRNAEKIIFDETVDEEERSQEVNRIKATEDGHYQELAIIANLRSIPGIEVFNDDGTLDEDGKPNQIGFKMLLGHFRGHLDGVITGLLQAPGTPHVLEIKCRLEKYINKLEKLIQEHGEKQALRQWEDEYYAQAIILMHAFELTRHYLVASTPGGRRQISVRTEYNRKEAEAIIEKAKSIIFDNWVLPARISESREYYKCKWCEFQEVCHDGRFPLVNCKTCRYSEPVDGGLRNCTLKDEVISDEIIHGGCGHHLYNPALISGATLIEHKDDHVIYAIEEKKIKFANVSSTSFPDLGSDFDSIYTSVDLRENIKFVSGIKKEDAKPTTKTKKEWNTANKIDPRLKGI